MSRELLQQALDALTLECCDNDGNSVDLIQPAIAALEAELAKPEQKPIQLRRGDRLRPTDSDDVVCTVWATSTTGKTLVKWGANDFCEYTAEQIGELFWLVPRHEQEPVSGLDECHRSWLEKINKPKTLADFAPTYTAPPRKEWVGLTDEEIRAALEQEFLDGKGGRDLQDDKRVAKAIEAKLRELNT